jgi:hypothetical protein
MGIILFQARLHGKTSPQNCDLEHGGNHHHHHHHYPQEGKLAILIWL